MRRTPGFATATALLAIAVAPAAAQVPPARPLPGTPVAFAAPLSSVDAVVELRDGRVLVHDRIERTLGVLTPVADANGEIARIGSGPLEYRVVGSLVRIAGDSIAVWDPGNSRFLLLSPGAAPVGAARLEERAPPLTSRSAAVPRAVDRAGRWYATLREVSAGDTTTLVRVSPGASRMDTIARFATPQLRPRRRAEGVIAVGAPGLVSRSAWAVLPDGVVLLIHGDSYTPEVVRPDGTRKRAASLPFVRVPVDAAARAAHLAETAAAMERMLGQELRGRGGGVMPRIEAEPPATWPAHRPPLESDTVHVDSRRRVWVRVVDAAPATGDRYDLLDAAGARVDAIRLPRGMRLVAMGAETLYATREDANGLIQLLRYPLP